MKRRALTKERVAAWLQRRFFLRLHMFFIVGATYLAGLVATYVLLHLGLNILWLRYPLAVCAAYLVFLASIRVWLAYIDSGPGGDADFSGDGIDFNLSGFDFGPGGGASVDFGGGGGNFGGGGASGSWGDAVESIAAPVKSSGGSASLDGCGIDGGGDEGCVIAILIVLVFSLLVLGIYLIYTAPVLLAEAAFEAALAAALARRAKKMESRGWVGTIWRATVWPFIAILVISAILGAAAQHRCPEAKKLRDVWNCVNAG